MPTKASHGPGRRAVCTELLEAPGIARAAQGIVQGQHCGVKGKDAGAHFGQIARVKAKGQGQGVKVKGSGVKAKNQGQG